MTPSSFAEAVQYIASNILLVQPWSFYMTPEKLIALEETVIFQSQVAIAIIKNIESCQSLLPNEVFLPPYLGFDMSLHYANYQSWICIHHNIPKVSVCRQGQETQTFDSSGIRDIQI